MTGRDVDQHERAATPLELLFDLAFVVAVAQLAASLAHDVADGHVAHGAGSYAMVFFSIWWAWMNFTWFASAYDTDDVPYRLLALLQMAGVLVLAAGVPAAFDDGDFAAVTAGYVLMRLAMVAQWLRAAREDPAHRAVALRYALGTAVVQVAWVALLAVSPEVRVVPFVVLALADVAVPVWAERHGVTTWHAGHIAERYGLFTLLVLGECVLAASTALQPAIAEGWGADPVLVGAGSLALVFSLWWLYFRRPIGPALAGHRELAFLWGYGHYALFAALAAVGAGLEVAAESLAHPVEAPDAVVGLAVAVPTAVVLVLVWALHAPLGAAPVRRLAAVAVAVVAVLVLGASAGSLLPVPWAVVAVAVAPAALVALSVLSSDPAPERVRAAPHPR